MIQESEIKMSKETHNAQNENEEVKENTVNEEKAQNNNEQETLKQEQKEQTEKEENGSKKTTKQGNAKSAAALSAAKAECDKLKKQLDDSNNTLLRTAAEYENFRKRSSREKDASFSFGVTHAIEKLLPVIDTLMLAISVETEDLNYKKGVEMTLEQCKKAFETLGVTEIDAIGKMFDPNLHAAVAQQEAAQEVESGTVLQVLQTGYMLSDKVIRHASVMVAQ